MFVDLASNIVSRNLNVTVVKMLLVVLYSFYTLDELRVGTNYRTSDTKSFPAEDQQPFHLLPKSN